METNKEVKCILVVNWKNLKCRVLSAKKKPSIKNGYEIPIHITLKLNIPDNFALKATGEVTLTQTQVNKMIIEQLKE